MLCIAFNVQRKLLSPPTVLDFAPRVLLLATNSIFLRLATLRPHSYVKYEGGEGGERYSISRLDHASLHRPCRTSKGQKYRNGGHRAGSSNGTRRCILRSVVLPGNRTGEYGVLDFLGSCHIPTASRPGGQLNILGELRIK